MLMSPDKIMFIDQDNPLGAEILREAGEAYFSGCKKMVGALEALRAFDSALGPAIQDDEQVRRSRLLDDAAERVHSVLIQRDAMQLSGSETFLDDYGVPPEVIVRMGQRQRE
jgi:hypothetical protein